MVSSFNGKASGLSETSRRGDTAERTTSGSDSVLIKIEVECTSQSNRSLKRAPVQRRSAEKKVESLASKTSGDINEKMLTNEAFKPVLVKMEKDLIKSSNNKVRNSADSRQSLKGKGHNSVSKSSLCHRKSAKSAAEFHPAAGSVKMEVDAEENASNAVEERLVSRQLVEYDGKSVANSTYHAVNGTASLIMSSNPLSLSTEIECENQPIQGKREVDSSDQQYQVKQKVRKIQPKRNIAASKESVIDDMPAMQPVMKMRTDTNCDTTKNMSGKRRKSLRQAINPSAARYKQGDESQWKSGNYCAESVAPKDAATSLGIRPRDLSHTGGLRRTRSKTCTTAEESYASNRKRKVKWLRKTEQTIRKSAQSQASVFVHVTYRILVDSEGRGRRDVLLLKKV